MKRTVVLVIGLILLIISTISCDRNKTNSTSNKKDYTPDLSEDFNLITQFFEEQIGISSTFDEQAKIDTYDQFRLNIKRYYEDENVPIDFEKQRELYQKLSMYFFSTTWRFGLSTSGRDTTIYKYLSLRPDSHAVTFINQESSSEFIKEYVKTLKAAGGISPANSGNMAIILSKSDLGSSKVRLLMALHFLTINDQINRHEPL